MESDTGGAGPGQRAVPDDLIQPFQIDPFSLRGRLVRLGPALDEILTRHDYPEEVATLLGEALALAAVLAGALKYEGVFSLQAKGDGPVSLVVADITDEGGLRGYAHFDEDRLADPGPGAGSSPVPRLLGAGYLAFTVDQGPDTERYQGIVELTGPTIAECAHHYFRQSEQLEAAIHLVAGRVPATNGGDEARERETEGRAWRAAGMMIQRLPGESAGAEGGRAPAADPEALEEGWRRALVLMSSVRAGELLDPELSPNRLLYRLFHEEGVRVYRATGLRPQCRCSPGRVERMLKSLPRDEVEDMKIDGLVIVTCEFCNASYRFDTAALDRIYGSAGRKP